MKTSQRPSRTSDLLDAVMERGMDNAAREEKLRVQQSALDVDDLDTTGPTVPEQVQVAADDRLLEFLRVDACCVVAHTWREIARS